MGQILSFPATAPREARGVQPAEAAGELVAMRHVDLDTVVRTVRFLRDIGRGHLLDGFNRGAPAATPPEAAKPVGRGKRRLPT